ncbi:MAG TPA: hypothetical protein VN843_18880 [Anaerolineales bacterium]|nr:hypothetical protein [Anaerolineales bacterium]
MKFTDGYWQMRSGMIPHYAAQVHEVKIDSNAMTVYAPTKKLSGRGDTINMPLLTVRISSPMENVIHVQLIHHKGTKRPKPEFTIYLGPTSHISLSNDEQAAMLTSGWSCPTNQKGTDKPSLL